ncbi:anthranilate phosphoribosyltransferase, partial [bacterium]|nr:anthranilate phosphoribosyltransferase [bacterium]
NLGSVHAMVVHGQDGLDEITSTESTRISELKDGNVLTYTISPADMDITIAAKEELAGGDKEQNAKITLDILNGTPGAKRNIVIMNTAAALMAADKSDSLPEAAKIAAEAIDSGKARKKLDEIKDISNRL